MKTHGFIFAVAAVLAVAFGPGAPGLNELHGQDPEAIVRVQAGNSLGSGTVFYRSANGDAFILTNHHVAGRKGSRVAIEFWDDGKLQAKRSAIVVEAQIDKAYTDVAIIRVSKADLGSLNPPYIPLAAPSSHVATEVVLSSRGCPGGVWQSQFVGRTFSSTAERMEFYPRPGGGRSGSSVLVAGKNEIAGLLTWSTGKPKHEDHGTDGSTNSSGNGIAQQVDSVWRVIRGQVATPVEERPEHFEELIYHPLPLSTLNSQLSTPQETPEQAADRLRRWRRLPPNLQQPPNDPLPGPGWDQPQGPIEPQPSPTPGDPGAPGLPPFSEPSDGPKAQPDESAPPLPPADEDGLLRRRFGDPQIQPESPPPTDDGLFGTRPERKGPIRRIIDDARGAFRFIVFGFAIYGAFCLMVKFRRAASTIVPALLLSLAMGNVSAQEPSPEYVQEMQGKADIWQAEPTAATERWVDYSTAYSAATADKAPLLVLVTMPGCEPCAKLKQELQQLDRLGYLNDTHTAIVDSVVDKPLADKFEPIAYPTLVVYTFDAAAGTYKQTGRHTGEFGMRACEPEPQSDGSFRLMISISQPLDAWLVDAGVK